eukprot:CAMPEP_0117444674 /NCGR_PEP_ID=MMETSP0759-20121206/5367_1 /TAXON_ID=63605 /ORGANISM="Percolomonas cosmopolitus, Strain WS" /LENGTH=574 /DNA_ID=CAMNT_0005236757 /DNA_START=8 /DNA_END=1732 /DNA_ORIENTATION=+
MFSPLFLSLASLLFLALHLSATQTGHPQTASELLSQQLHESIKRKGLRSRSDFLNVNDKGTQMEKTGNSLLRGNSQRSHTYTPAGSMHNGFKMTPLDDYVSRPDSHYQWSEFSTYYDEIAFDVHFLNVTSQKWLDEKTVSRSVWWHIIAVIRPLNYNQTEHGIMYITGSGNPAPGNLPQLKDESIALAALLALESGSIAVVQWQIPNERLEFYDEKPVPKSRSEDGIIAYTWNHFMDHPDQPDWLLRNPMVKGSNRALDAVEEYVNKKWEHKIEKWVVCGASKRGWTTWVLAAYDQAHEKRIVGFMPMVMSFLNMRKQFHAWWRNVGGYSFALTDYYALNFTKKFDSPLADQMAAIIDPLSYAERYANIPLMQIMASGDEFFQLTDTHLYWDQLPGEKYLLICENAEHSLISSLLDMLPSMVSFYNSIVFNIKRPQVSWKLDQANNKIIMESDVPPSTAKVWLGKTFSTTRRDFRIIRLETPEDPCLFPLVKGLCPNPIVWLPSHAKQISTTKYEASFPAPPAGWAGFFVQFQFADQGAGTRAMPHVFTSEGMVIPDTLPFPPCEGVGCTGKLI